MKILVLAKYSRKAAAFRYRIEQYLPYLAAAGIECEVSSLFDDAYLRERMETGRRSPVRALRAFASRLAAVARAPRYDAVLLYSEAFPYLPAWMERYLSLRGVPFVYDCDDAFFHQYDRHPSAIVRALLGGKIRTVMARAANVLAGNAYLREYALRANPNVTIAPTAIDLKRYSPRATAKAQGEPFVIGWIGSPSTAVYLNTVKEPLRRFFESKPNAVVRLVGSGPVEMPGVPLEILEWREDLEIEHIRSFDVGLMPLDGSAWSQGKCGFKIIQCFGCAVPVIASPVGVNAELVREGETGFAASTPDEWLAAFQSAYTDRSRLPSLGARGRELVAATYSIDAVAPRIVAALKAAATRDVKTS